MHTACVSHEGRIFKHIVFCQFVQSKCESLVRRRSTTGSVADVGGEVAPLRKRRSTTLSRNLVTLRALLEPGERVFGLWLSRSTWSVPHSSATVARARPAVWGTRSTLVATTRIGTWLSANISWSNSSIPFAFLDGQSLQKTSESHFLRFSCDFLLVKSWTRIRPWNEL